MLKVDSSTHNVGVANMLMKIQLMCLKIYGEGNVGIISYNTSIKRKGSLKSVSSKIVCIEI